MGIFKRGTVNWISYSIPKAMAEKFGCARLIRESVKSGDAREAERLLKLRKREIADETWSPVGHNSPRMTVVKYAERWTARRKRDGLRIAVRDTDMLRVMMTSIGEKRLTEVRRADVRRAVEVMRNAKAERGKAKGKPYAPMTVHRAYGALRAMLNEAMREELILANPCTLTARSGELPIRKDADPAFRSGAIFTRAEIARLLTSSLVPEYRRTLYALLFYGGLRFGEAVARTWGDYDTEAKPLGRLVVATQHEGRELKTSRPREVPVHPDLAAILAKWRREQYAKHYGKAALPSDYIVRNLRGRRCLSNATWGAFLTDLERLGMRRRRLHDLRRTLITLARADGAQGELLRFVTHGASGSIMDCYTSPPWATLCAQISAVHIQLHT